MAKETYQITDYVHDEVIAYCTAFGIIGTTEPKEDINHLIFHPGGKKIVHTFEGIFRTYGKNIDDTKEVLRLYGNMSSATVLYVLERFMDGDRQEGEKGLMLSFGPGFSAQRILLQW